MASALYAHENRKVRDGNTIAGHVIDAVTEENVPFAKIWVAEIDKGYVGNEEGQFEITALNAGKYTLRVTAMGYETMTKEVTVSREFATVVHFKLKEESQVIDEVVVSANRNEISRKDAPVVVSVANLKLFETVNSVDLAKSLNYITGLRVENNCQNCGFPEVRL